MVAKDCTGRKESDSEKSRCWSRVFQLSGFSAQGGLARLGALGSAAVPVGAVPEQEGLAACGGVHRDGACISFLMDNMFCVLFCKFWLASKIL